MSDDRTGMFGGFWDRVGMLAALPVAWVVAQFSRDPGERVVPPTEEEQREGAAEAERWLDQQGRP